MMNQVFGHRSGFTDFNTSEMNRMHGILRSASAQTSGSFGINASFDVNTRKGRDLMHFLSNLDNDDIEKRKTSRIDASAAALVARQAYKFQAIDGTGLGWSSASLAKCLISLTKLYDEHHLKFKVDSFYPLRLVLSNAEGQDKVDLFGGVIMLNPGSTQIQWLDTLMSVSEQSIKQLETNRSTVLEKQTYIQNALNIRLKKGYSCTSREYYDFLNDMSSVMLSMHEEGDTSSSTALTPERIQVVLETAQACRRVTLTNSGEIRVSTGMTIDSIISSIRSRRQEAREKVDEEALKKKRAKELVAMIQYDLGMSQIFKARLSTITSDQYLSSLTALLNLPYETKTELKERVAGNNLGITGSGRSCHLGDDGSIIIPFDWR